MELYLNNLRLVNAREYRFVKSLFLLTYY